MDASVYEKYQSIITFLLALSSILILNTEVRAATFCVSSASELKTALAIAASNGEDDTVEVVQGNYAGNFVYASTEPSDISIEGGYTTACGSKVVDASNTIMDGSNNDSVLVLSSDQSVNFNVDGLTLQNGTAKTITPSGGTAGGGLNVITNGSLTLTNSTVTGSSAGSGGGVCVGPNYWANNITITLSNNTISNNYATYGGGIYTSGAGMIILTNNTITDNTAGSGRGASGGGGGVYLHGYGTMSTIILSNNTIKNNTANNMINGFWTGGVWVGGGGVFVESNTITLSNNTIIHNTARSGSGGVFATASTSITLKNNIISDNTADVGSEPPGGGGGLYLYGSGTMSTIRLANNTFTGNTAGNDGGGLMIGLREDDSVAGIYNNIIWNNGAAASADIYINNDGDGDFLPATVHLYNNDFDQSADGTYIKVPFSIDPSNLNDADPHFIDPDNGDFHLTLNSPCIDTGTPVNAPDNDIDGDLRPQGAGYDIGADEYFIATNLAEIIGTWSNGIWYWDTAAAKWTKMAASTPTGDIAAGDFTGDGSADVASCWSNGLWYQDGDTLDWTKVSNTAPTQLTAGDVTGDGHFEIIGTWSNGIWYWDESETKWTKMAASTPTGDIAAGDFTGDGKADIASCWDNGLWYQDGETLGWTKISGTAPDSVTAGDVTGDGRFEIIGTWSNGIWYWDESETKWTKMAASTPTGDIAAGDFTGDGKADVASCWDNGLWYQDGETLDWTRVSNTAPTQLTAGDVTGD